MERELLRCVEGPRHPQTFIVTVLKLNGCEDLLGILVSIRDV